MLAVERRPKLGPKSHRTVAVRTPPKRRNKILAQKQLCQVDSFERVAGAAKTAMVTLLESFDVVKAGEAC